MLLPWAPIKPSLSQKRAEYGLDNIRNIRETIKPLYEGCELQDLDEKQKTFLDGGILACCCVLDPPLDRIEPIKEVQGDIEESVRLRTEYEFGLPGSYRIAKTPKDKKQLRDRRLNPRTWFRGLKTPADYTQLEKAYYESASYTINRPWKCSIASGEAKDEHQAGVPLSQAFLVKYLYPELELRVIYQRLGLRDPYCEHDFERVCGNLQLPKSSGNPFWEHGREPLWKDCCRVKQWRDACRPVDESSGIRTFILSNRTQLRIGRPFDQEYYYDPVRSEWCGQPKLTEDGTPRSLDRGLVQALDTHGASEGSKRTTDGNADIEGRQTGSCSPSSHTTTPTHNLHDGLRQHSGSQSTASEAATPSSHQLHASDDFGACSRSTASEHAACETSSAACRNEVFISSNQGTEELPCAQAHPECRQKPTSDDSSGTDVVFSPTNSSASQHIASSPLCDQNYLVSDPISLPAGPVSPLDEMLWGLGDDPITITKSVYDLRQFENDGQLHPAPIRRRDTKSCYEEFDLWPALAKAAARAGLKQGNPTTTQKGYIFQWSDDLHLSILREIMYRLLEAGEKWSILSWQGSVHHTAGRVHVPSGHMVVIVPTVLPIDADIYIKGGKGIQWSDKAGFRIFGPATYWTTGSSYFLWRVPIV